MTTPDRRRARPSAPRSAPRATGPDAAPLAPSSRLGRPSLRVPLLVFTTVLSTSIAAWALLERRAAPLPVPRSPTASGRPAETLSGPWGTIELRDLVLDPRGDYLTPGMCDGAPPVWQLPRLGPAEATRLYDQAGLRAELRAALVGATTCAAGGCEVRPGLDLLGRLSATERAGLYAGVGRFEANAAQYQPMRSPPGQLERSFTDAGASEATLARLRAVLYRDGRTEAFADLPLLCAGAPDDAERRRILAAVVREHGLLATLRVPEGADVEALARYWGVGRRGKDLGALLGALARAPGGGEIDLVHLLPRFARARINTFPEPDDARYDCAHAALSFFTRDGDDRFLRPGEVKRAIDADYHPVAGNELQMGDVLVFTAADGSLVHAVVHLAGDLVFTKNGIAFHKPWKLARRSELEAAYGFPRIYAYRRSDPSRP